MSSSSYKSQNGGGYNGGAKRKFPSNNNNNNKNGNGPHKRQRRAGGGSYEVQALSASAGTSRLKKKIRDMERLLKNGKFLENNSEKRLETERALDALRAQLGDAAKTNRAREVAAKYHKIRFVERKKAARRVIQQVKAYAEQVKEGEEEEEGVEKEVKKALADAEVDLYYTIVFPRGENYVSLYPTAEEPDDSQIRTEIRETVRREIRKLIDVEVLPSGFILHSSSVKADEGDDDKNVEEDQDKNGEEDQDVEDEEEEKAQKSSKKDKNGDRPTSQAIVYADELRRRVVDNNEVLIAAEIVSSIREKMADTVKKTEDAETKDEEDASSTKKRKKTGKSLKKEQAGDVNGDGDEFFQ